jgi:hypothetical protein
MLWALHVIHIACTAHLEISPVHQGQIGCDRPGPENCMWLDHIWKKKSQDGCAEQVIFKHTCTVSSVFTSCSNLTIPWYNSIFFSYTYNKIMWYSSAKCKNKIKNNTLAHMLYMLMLWIGGQAIFYCTCMSRNVASSVVNLDDTSPTCLYLASYFFVIFSTWN